MYVFESLLVMVLAVGVSAYPDGAPPLDAVCRDVSPGGPHVKNDNMPQSTFSPYEVESPSYMWTAGGQPIDVKVETHDPIKSFMGFMVRAFDDQGNSIGSFMATGAHSQVRHCPNNMGDMITHTGSYGKREVVFMWNPPPYSNSRYVRFHAAVVESEYVYWNSIIHEVIRGDGPVSGVGKLETILSGLVVLVLSAIVLRQ